MLSVLSKEIFLLLSYIPKFIAIPNRKFVHLFFCHGRIKSLCLYRQKTFGSRKYQVLPTCKKIEFYGGHAAAKMQFAVQHLYVDWTNVIFSDEITFRSNANEHKYKIWQRKYCQDKEQWTHFNFLLGICVFIWHRGFIIDYNKLTSRRRTTNTICSR